MSCTEKGSPPHDKQNTVNLTLAKLWNITLFLYECAYTYINCQIFDCENLSIIIP